LSTSGTIDGPGLNDASVRREPSTIATSAEPRLLQDVIFDGFERVAFLTRWQAELGVDA
jgi:hypothetical protein